MGEDLAVDAVLPHTPSDQLGVLRAKIQDNYTLEQPLHLFSIMITSLAPGNFV